MDRLLLATARAQARHFWFRGFRAFVGPMLSRAARGRHDLRLIDCGSGTGSNLSLLEHHGQAYGFDISMAGLLLGRAAGRLRTVRANVTAAPFADGTFDVAASFDVLYSLPEADARRALAEMHRLLKPGGAAVINIAAMPVLRGDHSVLSHEIHRFRRTELRTWLTDAGFEVERITYTNFSLFLPMLLARTAQRVRGLKAEPEAEREIVVPPEPLNGLFSAVLLFESFWLRWLDMPAGSSLLCLARKPAGART